MGGALSCVVLPDMFVREDSIIGISPGNYYPLQFYGGVLFGLIIIKTVLNATNLSVPLRRDKYVRQKLRHHFQFCR